MTVPALKASPVTVRGVIVRTARWAALAVVALVLVLAFLTLNRMNQSATEQGPGLFSASQADQPADPAGGLALEGPVVILGPDGSTLSSETGAVLNPKTGDLDLLGPSALSTTH